MDSVEGTVSAAADGEIVCGDYQVLAKLATGGMAEIYLARRVQGAADEGGELVVLKRILAHLARDEQFVSMFCDEARLAARLNHPNVCHVEQLGSVGRDYFIVMEYLHGVALSQLLQRWFEHRAALDLPLAAGILCQACEGLHYAHELRDHDGTPLGVVHRDVSPGNIFLTAGGLAKVLDFGVAKAAGAMSRTRTGTIKGKSSYMSPEQIMGHPVDRRSDVFALGVMLWEMLAMSRLFRRDTEFLTFKAITEEPVPDIGERRPDLPPAVRAVVMRALMRERGDRFPTARAFGEALAAALRPMGGPLPATELSALIRDEFSADLSAKRRLYSGATDRPDERGGTRVRVRSLVETETARPPAGDAHAFGREFSLDLDAEISSLIAFSRAEEGSTTPTPSALAVGSDRYPALAPNATPAAPPRRRTGVRVALGSVALAACAAAAIGFGLEAGSTSERAPGRAQHPRAAVAVAPAVPPPAPVASPAPVAEPAPADEAPAPVASDDEPGPPTPSRSRARARTDRRDRDRNRADAAGADPRPGDDSEPGFFSIDAAPYATIYVDGRELGVTPIFRARLSPGRHAVKVVSSTGATRALTVHIKAGRESSQGKLLF